LISSRSGHNEIVSLTTQADIVAFSAQQRIVTNAGEESIRTVTAA
jgi:hypothetical protein